MKKNYFALTRSKFRLIISITRRYYYVLFGLKIQKGGSLGKIYCEWPNRIFIGEKCIIQDNVDFRIAFPFSKENFISIGDRVFIGCYCQFNANTTISIGNDCMIASSTIFVDAGHGTERNSTMNAQAIIAQQIVISDDVWIGADCKILKGVSIGRGSVIGAGSVVNRSIPEYQIWAGTPARFIRNRN